MPAPIPLHELTFRATRAGGPGGQHVNTSSTRIELWWHPAASPALTEEERSRLVAVLDHRLDGAGWLRLVAAGSRSQAQNREAAIERFQRLVAAALVPPKQRTKTKPPRAAKEQRLRDKKRRSATKAERRSGAPED